MNIETAKKVVEPLECANRAMFGLIPYLEERCDNEELNNLKREIARVANGIDINLYPIILKQYPELNPLQGKE
jgi:hypothetical protein